VPSTSLRPSEPLPSALVRFTLLFFLLGAIVILVVLTLQSRSAPYGDMLRQLIVCASTNDCVFDSSS
jgi:hypothetical protein